MKLVKNTYNITSDKIPQDFDNFTITQISDLHGRKVDKQFFDNIDGDIVVLTGDILDGSEQNSDYVANFVWTIAQSSPVYYITGNHEATNINLFNSLERTLSNTQNVHFLHNESIEINRGESKINLIGLDDLKYDFVCHDRDRKLLDDRLVGFDMSDYTIVLLHSPNNAETISIYEPDLVLCGHTHGGQCRLPKLGCVYAPGQGLFPKYDRGQYKVKKTDLIVSSGVGFSRIPIRINCPAEINNVVLCSRGQP